jgi:hypothetical protein
MNFVFISFLLSLSSHLWAQTSYVAPARVLQKKSYQFNVTSDYFKSTNRIDADGKRQPLVNGQAFSRYQTDLSLQYAPAEGLQVGGGIRLRQNSSTIQLNNSTQNSTETSTGVESTYASIMYGFKPVDRWQYSLEGVFRFRPYSNEETVGTNTAPLVLGEEGSEYSGGLAVTYSAPRANFLSTRLGFRRPGSEISDEFYWQIEGALTWKFVAFVTGVNGISSLNKDPYEGQETQRPNYYTGSTYIYNGKNRESIAPYAGVNFALGHAWRLELRGTQIVAGRSTDLGTAFGFSIIRRLEEKNQKAADRKFKEYDFEGTITKISPQKGYVVIDKGLSEDVQKGMKIDFYEFDYIGGNILIASGLVVISKADSSIVKITHHFNKKRELKEGVVARGNYR